MRSDALCACTLSLRGTPRHIRGGELEPSWRVSGIGRDTKVMGQFTNPPWVNVWGWIVTVVMGGSAVALFVFAALGK